MSNHDLFCKDYQKNPIPELLRFVFIAFNLIASLFCTGYLEEGLNRNEVFKTVDNIEVIQENSYRNDISVLDMIAVIMVVYLTMKQLAFGRLRVDSLNEIIFMPAQDKRFSLKLVNFSIFKFFAQLIFVDYANLGGFFETIFMFSKSKDKKIYYTTMLYNVMLILLSSACSYYSWKFEFCLRNAEKNLIMNLLDFVLNACKITIGSLLLYITFIQKNRLIGTLFLLVIIATIIKFIHLRMSNMHKGAAIDLKKYMVYLKWISFFSLCLVVLTPLILKWLVKMNSYSGIGFFNYILLLNNCKNRDPNEFDMMVKVATR